MERPSLLSRVLSAAILCGFAGVLLLQPLSASALGDSPTIKDKAGIPGYPAVSITENLPERINAVYENIRWELMGAGTMAFMNAMQTFFGQLAYDAADYIASGGKGQSALYYEKGFEGYIKDVAGSAAGEFIGSLSQASFFQTIGFDLCRPPDPRTLLRIQLSLGNFLGQGQGVNQAFQRPQARCEFNDIIRNYEQVYQTLSNEDIISNVEASINTNSNDLGVSFMIFNRAASFVYNRRENAEKDRKEGNGYQALRDMISGRVKTPAETIREEANQVLVKDPKASQEQVNSFIIEQAYNLGPQRLAVYTASVFLNTLASKLLRRVFEDGIDLGSLFKRRNYFNLSRNPDELLEGNREDARKANITLRTPNLFKDRAYDVLAEMQSCPENRGTWNCVVDEGLAQALRSEGDAGAYTIQEAIDRGYLHSDWRLFPSTNIREERDPLCYTYGYCAGNLRKLRLMRILPVGFEFAADDKQNVERCSSERGCITLGEVVKNFTSCNERGERDEANPWCKLIDPNWALTIMPQQCALSGFGETMLDGNLPQRREECQDVQTCLQRNDKGECVGGYGYCVAEKTAYRFGAQECSARYASCRTYESRSGEQVSYLRNTLDYARCSEDTVGCMWYATTRDTSGGAESWIGTATNGPRVYFDKTMEACTAEQAGCTSLLAIPQETSALNLVSNASFERTIEGTTRLEDWQPIEGTDPSYVRPTVTVGEAAAQGTNVAHFAAGFRSGYRQVVDIAPGRTMVLSALIRRLSAGSGGSPALSVGLLQYPSRETAEARTSPIAQTVTARDYSSRECVVSYTGAIGPNAEPYYQSTDWARIECAFTTNQSAKAAEILIEGDNMLADAVMLEEGTAATAYLDGVNGQLPQVYHKVAPDEFACSGGDADHPSCANYARVCKQTEANCDGYTDLSSDLPEVSAQLNRGDLCPSSCVGYAEYRKLASSFDLVQSTNDALNDRQEAVADYFIPSTAQQCTQEAVGCEVFTVVDGAEQGGESTAAYSSLRFCELPGNDTDTYFTWEGSDAAGYQLRTWALKKRTTEKPGMVPPEGATIATNAGPRIVVKPAGDLFSQKDPLNCNETSWRTGGDADCRQFYNAGGDVFYRYYSQTVLSTNDCRQFRLASTNEDDCGKTGGTYNRTANTCTYLAYAPESRSCQASFAGCRAYAGAEAGNTRTVFSANGQPSSGAVERTASSNESLVVGDASYRYDVPARGTTTPYISVPTAVSGLYRVSFWAKATAPVVVQVATVEPREGDDTLVGTANITGEWKRVTLGLFSGQPGDRTRIEFRTSAGSSAAAVFIDEITVQQLRDVVFVKRGTWNTPAQCDQTAYGVPEPQAMLGCKQYQNRAGQSVAARQFSQLCRPTAVGCRAFVDTRNSSEPYRKVTSLADVGGASETVAPADRYIYLVDDPAKRCDADAAMCKAFGKPMFAKDRLSVERYETVYLKDDVRKYSEGLCKPSETFCEEFTTAAGREFFKDPQNHLCEYRERVSLAGFPGVNDGLYSGWFVKGESTPCYPDALASGQSFLLLKTGDRSPGAGYQGWGGSCPVEESECTEFKDPNDRASGATTGRSYYFINDERIDTRSCNNTYDPSRGCVLVRDMSSASLTYSLTATQSRYQREGLAAVAPVDCAQNPSEPGCATAATGRCIGTLVTTASTPIGGSGRITGSNEVVTRSAYSGGSCAVVQDCEAGARPTQSQNGFTIAGGGRGIFVPNTQTRVEDLACDRPSANDTNAIVKVRMDRDCAQWLGCASGETVFDPATNRYREMCTQVALCDKASEQSSAASYCSNYVNRATTSTEPVLVSGGYFSADTYAARPSGVGSRDYSGYAVPNAFQVMDLRSKAVAEDIQSVRQTSGNQDERRFVVAVKMPPVDTASLVMPNRAYRHTIPPTRPNQAEALSGNVPAYANFPAQNASTDRMLLCRHRGTGMIGYFLVSEARQRGEVNCYFAFSGEGEAAEFSSLINRYAASSGAQDLVLDQAYPKAVCRAYPENDAPFSSEYVDSWDQLRNPPTPVKVAQGYENAHFCARGEDCSCSYKRVEYPGRTSPLFFAWDSQAVPPGICVGGPRDGQTCIPSAVFEPSGATSTAARAAESANAGQGCGPASAGGSCVAFSKTEIVRGVQGVCLEYDTTRARGSLGDQSFPCLTWSPNPLVGGKDDPYRYVQTAGYFPPQNSGQYYCSSPVRVPQSVDILPTDFEYVPFGIIAPRNPQVDNQHSLMFDDRLTSDATELASTGNKPGAYVGSATLPKGSAAANQCESVDDYQDDDTPGMDNSKDPRATRLIGTGRGANESYTEFFYGVRPNIYIDPGSSSARDLTDRDLSFFEIKPFENTNGNGRLACGYNEDWVDGVRVTDYSSRDETSRADRQWRQAFFAEADLQTIITRGSEQILPDPVETNKPKKLRCLSGGGDCYYKYWEGGYRSQGQTKFTAFNAANGRVGGFGNLQVMKQCDSDKPFYAIRSVFEARAQNQENANISAVNGPWKFIGFWVTACGGKASSDNHFMYMNIRYLNADICRELLEVRSVKSSQDAAFTDRVWKESGYAVPLLNITYKSNFSPFSSALNTGPAGKHPLFMVPGNMAGVSGQGGSTFLAAGYSTYSGPPELVSPRHKYALLSNLFARIYRVYRYTDVAITSTDKICVGGSRKGEKCEPLPVDGSIPASGPSVQCGAPAPAGSTEPSSGGCQTVGARNQYVCNTLTGINVGRSMGDYAQLLSDTFSRDQQTRERALQAMSACSRGAFDPRPGRNRQIFGNCTIQARWQRVGDDQYRFGAEETVVTQRQAAVRGAFRCSTGSVRVHGSNYTSITDIGQPIYCTAEAQNSSECPIRVEGQCRIPRGQTIGTCANVRWTEGGEQVVVETTGVSCLADANCSFTEENYSRSGGPWTVEEQIPDINDPERRRTPYLDGRIGFVRIAGSDARMPFCRSGTCSLNDLRDPDRDNDLYTGQVMGLKLFSRLQNRPEFVQLFPSVAGLNRSTFKIALSTGDRVQMVMPGGTEMGDLDLQVGVNYGQCEVGTPNAGNVCMVARGTVQEPYSSWVSSWYSCFRQTQTDVTESSDAFLCSAVSEQRPSDSALIPSRLCRLPSGDGENETAEQYYRRKGISPGEQTPDNDNNICTSSAGYHPDPKICPNPTSEFCGLISYDMRVSGGNPSTFEAARMFLPTDVTLGHYTPTYLNPELGQSDYAYIDYYTPRPPRIAAPAATCPVGMTCGVQDLDRFAFNGITEGIINVVGGQHRSSLKFFGWAAHEQMAIRKLAVDWGDGTIERFDDVRMKNRKPFCSAQKECYSSSNGFTGLTCQSDNDCPLTAQACRQMGSCKAKEHIVCGQDSDCRRDGTQDVCQFRTFFGNSAEACDATPFDFSHVYACRPNAQQTLPKCADSNYNVSGITFQSIPADVVSPTSQQLGTCFFGGDDSLVMGEFFNSIRPTCRVAEECTQAYRQRASTETALANVYCGRPSVMSQPVLPEPTQARCSGDTTRHCAVDGDCATGDRCVRAGLAPPGGCWDEQNNTCRYTPRVFLQDNWGWCTGECRSARSGDQLVDASTSRIRHPYGGCYTPIPEGGTALDAVRPNTQTVVTPDAPSELLQRSRSNENLGIECALDGAMGTLTNNAGRVSSTDPRRNYRPWVVFPGSLQLRPR